MQISKADTVLVTGGARGIGRAVAEAFAAEGATVVVADISPAESGAGIHIQHPAGRVGRPEDIAAACLYLVGADFVTGQNIVIDGGMTKRMIYVE